MEQFVLMTFVSAVISVVVFSVAELKKQKQ
jgi:hypothetical protein